MEKYLTKEQMQTILDSRPKGVPINDALDMYVKNGWTIQGVNEPKSTLQQTKEVATGFAKGVGRTASMVSSGVQDIKQGISGGLESLVTGKPLSETKAMQPGEGYDIFKRETQQGQALTQALEAKTPEEKLGGQLETGAELLAGGGASLIKSGVVGGAKALSKGVTAVAESPIVQGVADVTKMAGESVKRIPSRIATNVAEKQAQEMAIKSLPTPKAQVAVRDGIDIVDVQNLPNVVKGTQAQKLIQTVKDFAQGKTKTDPIEVVGQPIIQRVKELNKTKESVGKKLGDVAKNLGTVTKPELTSGVFSALEKVPSLQGLKLTPKGTLDFSKTTLADALRKTDRQAVQKAFTEATKWGDGLKAHNFRQSLFEILGGKKKSLTNLTDTEEQALNAIRKGLSDVLETKNNSYKTLSNEYRKIVQPLGDLRKLMKNIDPNSTEDILDMSAGLLARRITSAASSNPQIKQLLQALDSAGNGGNLKQGISELQDLYNVLNKYYDIAPKTGFQNLVKEGVGASDSLVGTIKETARDIAGQSNAVRQKALEDYLEELLTKSR